MKKLLFILIAFAISFTTLAQDSPYCNWGAFNATAVGTNVYYLPDNIGVRSVSNITGAWFGQCCTKTVTVDITNSSGVHTFFDITQYWYYGQRKAYVTPPIATYTGDCGGFVYPTAPGNYTIVISYMDGTTQVFSPTIAVNVPPAGGGEVNNLPTITPGKSAKKK